jgi:Uma2 family endonuclease
MTPLLTPPPKAPTPLRWTCDSFHALCDTGVFSGRKAMLIDGVIITMAMPSPAHNTSLNLTQDVLRAVFTVGHHVRNQQAFDVGTANDPGPDLAVVPGGIRDYATRQATAAVLVVEVADTSLFLDTTTKAELYVTAGVQDYWVIDLDNRQLLVFRDPVPLPQGLGATAYRTHLTFGPSDLVSPLAAPNTSIPVGDLLP